MAGHSKMWKNIQRKGVKMCKSSGQDLFAKIGKRNLIVVSVKGIKIPLIIQNYAWAIVKAKAQNKAGMRILIGR